MLPVVIYESNKDYLRKQSEQVSQVSKALGLDYDIKLSTCDANKVCSYIASNKEPTIYFLDNDCIKSQNLAERIRASDKASYIVFCTSLGASFMPFGYTSKNAKSRDIEDLLIKIQENYLDLNDYEVRLGGMSYKVKQTDIIYVTKLRNTIKLITSEKEITCYDTLRNLSKILDRHIFVRTHQSFIVQKRYIAEITEGGTMLKLTNGHNCPISRTYKKMVKTLL